MRPAYCKALLAGGLAISTAAPASESASESASELRLSPLFMPETRTLPAGSAEMGAQAELLRYNDPNSSESVTDMDLTPELAFGITDALEVAFSGPYRQRIDDQQGGGWRHVAARLTYRLLDLGNRASALTLKGSALSDNSDAQVASGRNTYGAEWHMSGYSATGATHIALGYAQRDYPLVQEEPVYESETEYYAQWGFGYLLAPELAFTGELSYDYGEKDNQGSAEIMPGFRYTPPDSGVSMAMGLGFRPGTDDFRPNSRVLLSITYRPPGPAGLSSRVGKLEQEVGNLRGELQGLAQQLKEQESGEAEQAKAPEPKPVSKPRQESSAISLGLVNASGQPSLGEAYADRLRKMGYAVVEVSLGEGPVKSVTHLYYRDSQNKAAVTLGRALPETQTLTHYTHLPNGVDIQVVLGSDQIDEIAVKRPSDGSQAADPAGAASEGGTGSDQTEAAGPAEAAERAAD